MVRKAKKESWLKFVMDEGSKDPYGMPYKIAMSKIKKEEVISSLEFDRRLVRDPQELANKLLDKLLRARIVNYQTKT